MNREYLVTLAERVWHWLNAALFLTLAASGLLMHASGRLTQVSLSALIRVHHAAALLFALNFLFWFGYQLHSRRVRHYLTVERDVLRRLVTQARFYLLGIFSGGPHPLPVSAESKFNPLQRVTYLGLMFGLVPLQIASGAVLYGFTLKSAWLAEFSWFRMAALGHTALSYLLIAFLIGHLYLTTTGKTPLALVKTMVTGWHEPEEVGDGSD